jgi:hypothetical protein
LHAAECNGYEEKEEALHPEGERRTNGEWRMRSLKYSCSHAAQHVVVVLVVAGAVGLRDCMKHVFCEGMGLSKARLRFPVARIKTEWHFSN